MKALNLQQIDAAVNKFQAVSPDNPFFVDFSNVRGSFQEREVMRILNTDERQGRYIFNYKYNQNNKTLLFLAGMRGSGKTSELAKYAQKLNANDCFFVVTCNIDEELDLDNVEYMDILIFQIKKLLERADEVGLELDNSILESMQKWFEVRVNEINKSLKADGNLELEIAPDRGAVLGSVLKYVLGITAKINTSLSGSLSQATVIRQSFKNSFVDFSSRFNIFIEQVNDQLRKEGQGQEVLFIIDGLEKTMSAETRRKIIMQESNRIRQIKANTIFTLPIELMKEARFIEQFSEIVNFPTIKVKERDGSPCPKAIAQLTEFVFKRIDKSLFENEEMVERAVLFSGGSPRQLLRILEQCNWMTSEDEKQLMSANLDKAIEKLANKFPRYLNQADYDVLKRIKSDIDNQRPSGFEDDQVIQNLLESEIVFEYNDGTDKRVNPLVEVSKLYIHNVMGQ